MKGNFVDRHLIFYTQSSVKCRIKVKQNVSLPNHKYNSFRANPCFFFKSKKENKTLFKLKAAYISELFSVTDYSI